MKILFVGGHRTFEAFRAMLRATRDEKGEENSIRWAGHDDVMRGVAAPIHIIYDDDYLASGRLNAREEENIRTVMVINMEANRGNRSRNDPHQIDRRGHAATAPRDAGDGREANSGGDISHLGITASRYNDAGSSVFGEEPLHGGRKGPLKNI
jgi:hypothetical protein